MVGSGGVQADVVPLPPYKIALIATRRCLAAASAITNATVTTKLIFHHVLRRMTVPLDELSQNDIVVLEVPPVKLVSFETDLLT